MLLLAACTSRRCGAAMAAAGARCYWLGSTGWDQPIQSTSEPRPIGPPELQNPTALLPSSAKKSVFLIPQANVFAEELWDFRLKRNVGWQLLCLTFSHCYCDRKICLIIMWPSTALVCCQATKWRLFTGVYTALYSQLDKGLDKLKRGHWYWGS